MKKLLFGAAALALLATSSCKKDDKDATGPSNTLTAASETYAVTSFGVNKNIVTITGGSGTANAAIFTLNFGTGTATPTAGTYNIVSNADAANEVELGIVRYVNSTLTRYEGQDGSTNVTVSMDGTKMRISFPTTTVKPLAGMGSDNITVSANAQQL